MAEIDTVIDILPKWNLTHAGHSMHKILLKANPLAPQCCQLEMETGKSYHDAFYSAQDLFRWYRCEELGNDRNVTIVDGSCHHRAAARLRHATQHA